MPTTTPLPAADQDLVARVASVVDVAKAGPADSFVLHAPLELLARALLLERLPEERRGPARSRIAGLADQYVDHGPAADPQPRPRPVPVDDLVTTLAAAGHAPILLTLRPRVPWVTPDFGDRLVAVELAAHPDWSLAWPRRRPKAGRGSGDLSDRLAAPPSPGDPGSTFIYPTMHRTEASGLADDILTEPLRGMGVSEARRTLLRVAARSMLQDDPVAAPYGWTHCLTLPQAALAAADHGADADLAVAVAAIHVLGFRATQGRVRLDDADAWRPEPGSAADRVWHTDDAGLPAAVEDLVAFGAAHADAHVAKYTLACLDAAEADPEATRLFLAAAAHLHEWWVRAASA